MMTAGSFAQFLFSIRVESLLILLAGIMSVLTSWVSYRNSQAFKYKLLLLAEDQLDLVGLCCVTLTATGLLNIILAVLRSIDKLRSYPALSRIVYRSGCNFYPSYNGVSKECLQVSYIYLIVLTLISNFAVGIFLTEYKHELSKSLEDNMYLQLKESVLAKQRFGVGFQLSEAWDYMQIKLMCCGVESYKDYMDLGGISSIKSDMIPLSCCAMRRFSSAPEDLSTNQNEGFRLQPDNLSQCRLDAKQGIASSIFLRTQGCRSPITRWLLRYINKTIAMVFATICLQTLAVLYISWMGFRKSSIYASARGLIRAS